MTRDQEREDRMTRFRAIDLRAVGASLAEATASLAAAIDEPGSGPGAGLEQGPAGHQPGGPE